MYLRQIFLFLFLLFLFSCSTDTSEKQQERTDKHFVSAVEIRDLLAQIQLHKQIDRKTVPTSKANEIKEIHDTNGSVLLYIVNYDQNGFMILSSDKRTNPVLAYSDENSFKDTENDLPPGLTEWLDAAKEYLRKTKSSTRSLSREMTTAWKPSQIQQIINQKHLKSKSAGDCEAQFEMVLPLLKTKWGQGTGYNDLVPFSECGINGTQKAPTGCVATAMAQIMNYYRFPPNYDWDKMPDSSSTLETARLMRDIGIAVGMKYACNGSSTNTRQTVTDAFKKSFQYKEALYSDYDYQIIRKQLQSNKPVILCGGQSSGIFGIYKNGHAWVCDGYKSLAFSRHCWWLNRDFSYYLLHMNWGWKSKWDGWYDYRFWYANKSDYNYKRGIIHDITP